MVVTSKDVLKDYDYMYAMVLGEIRNANEEVIKKIFDICYKFPSLFIEKRSAKAHICATDNVAKVVMKCKIAEVRTPSGFAEVLCEADKVEFFTKGNGEIEIDMYFNNCLKEVASG